MCSLQCDFTVAETECFFLLDCDCDSYFAIIVVTDIAQVMCFSC